MSVKRKLTPFCVATRNESPGAACAGADTSPPTANVAPTDKAKTAA
jgi:hypothetical protein